MSGLDQSFRDIMAASQKDFEAAQVINNWKPDIGDYTAVLKAPVSGVKEGTGPWMRLPAIILAEGDPDNDGREFTAGFYGTKNLSQLKQDTAILSGKAVNNILEALTTLEKAEGWVVSVNVRSYTNKKTGDKGKIVSLTGVVDRPAATTPPTA
jgi:hypothetical protein